MFIIMALHKGLAVFSLEKVLLYLIYSFEKMYQCFVFSFEKM